MSAAACCGSSHDRSVEAEIDADAAAPVSEPALGATKQKQQAVTLVNLDEYEETGTRIDEYHRLVRNLSERSRAYLQLLQAGGFGYQHMGLSLIHI